MSDSLINPKYDLCRRHIEIARQNGTEWDRLNDQGMSAGELDSWFQMQEKFSYWPSLGGNTAERVKRWQDIVAAKRAAEEASIAATRPLVVVGVEESEPGIQVPTSNQTAWQLYSSHLIAQGWKKTAIDGIETSSLKILRHMRRTTAGRNPVKGLVVGHVQSGKTASMAGLIAMAADYRWNLFIVLSGTLENLRMQTKNRLYRDLNHHGNLSWKSMEHPRVGSPTGERAQDLQFHPDSKDRHLIVSLKNSSRLEALISWVKANTVRMKQMKIVIIDDEADQAGINTADVSKDERTKINGLILSLVNLPVQSVNYVAYTATPAANFLNEGPGSSLYPEDFIVALQQADEHFGPVQIFGRRENGDLPLGIIEDIDADDLSAVRTLHDGTADTLPGSLHDSVLWFLCCVAAMRTAGFKKPVSMLIHTSSRQIHHENVGAAVRKFLTICASDTTAFLTRCADVWSARTSNLDPASFAQRFPRYGRLEELSDYPDFEALSSELPVLVAKISAIKLDESNARSYHTGLHLCIDNCANNGITDENEVRRLFYPDPAVAEAPDFATAFIVIGGGTLSRGLTIENLVSTFFLRGSAQADSLMQMGRWFGYRKGYELLPRIWMPEETHEKFKFMTLAEEDLRDDLQRFMYAGAKPAEFGPRVRVHPRGSWLRPTAKNRMQQSIAAEYDFSGVNRQTTIFHDGDGAGSVHLHNRQHTEAFLWAQGNGTVGQRGTTLIWHEIPVADVASFLRDFKFHSDAQFFSEIEAFIAWLKENAEQAGYEKWNVVVAGNKVEDGSGWRLPGGDVGLISRSRLVAGSSNGGVSIGVLRDPRDLLADAQLDKAEVRKRLANADIEELRERGGVGSVPQLLLYLIDKDSTPGRETAQGDPEKRARLDAAEHVLGVSLWLPGSRGPQRSFVSHVTVRIPQELAATDDDLTEIDLAGTA